MKKDIAKDPMLLNMRTEENKRTSEEAKSIEDEIDPCPLLAQSHYVVSGSVGVRAQMQVPMPIVID